MADERREQLEELLAGADSPGERALILLALERFEAVIAAADEAVADHEADERERYRVLAAKAVALYELGRRGEAADAIAAATAETDEVDEWPVDLDRYDDAYAAYRDEDYERALMIAGS